MSQSATQRFNTKRKTANSRLTDDAATCRRRISLIRITLSRVISFRGAPWRSSEVREPSNGAAPAYLLGYGHRKELKHT
jgi:hypothetical protein